MPANGDPEAIKEYCLDHVIPDDFWLIAYDEEISEERPELRLPTNLGRINFGELIKRLDREVSECAINQLYGLQAAEEQGLACVRLVGWLLQNGRL